MNQLNYIAIENVINQEIYIVLKIPHISFQFKSYYCKNYSLQQLSFASSILSLLRTIYHSI